MNSRYASAILFVVAVCAGLRAQRPVGRQAVQQQPPVSQQQAGQKQKPPQQQPPTFRAGVNLVRVDVIVTDKQGRPVTDLTAADFDLTEDNRPQHVDSFKLIRVEDRAKPGDEEPREIHSLEDESYETSREDVRLVVFMLDDYHVSVGAALRLRPALRQFMQTRIGPNDLVAIMYPLTPVSALRFTHSGYDLATDLETFEGRKGIYMVRNDAEALYAAAPTEMVESIRTEVSLSALESLVTHLGSLREGRKSVVLVSEGFPLAMDEMKELQYVYDAANRNNTAIYTLDPLGLTTNRYDEYMKDTLRILSNNTDGRAVINRNDLTEGLQAVLSDSSFYYLIGYNSDLPAPDGKFHEIKVRVKRSGVEVRARKGYWSPTPEEAAKSLAPPTPEAPAAVTKALSTIARPSGGQTIRTWIGTARGESGKTRVTFVWEPLPAAADTPSAQRPARVMLSISGARGETYFSGAMFDRSAALSQTPAQPATPPAVSSAQKVPAPAAGGYATFEAPPGKVQVKLTVQNATAEVIDSDAREVVVPDLTGADLKLSTPVVFRSRTPLELRAIMADAHAVPTADREFSRTDRLLIRVDAYAPGGGASMSARLLNRAGVEMTVLPIQPNAGDTSKWTLDLPLVSLAPGEYLIELKAKGPSGEATEVVAIRVTS